MKKFFNGLKYIINKVYSFFKKEKKQNSFFMLPYLPKNDSNETSQNSNKVICFDEASMFCNQSYIEFNTIVMGSTGTGKSYFSEDLVHSKNTIFFNKNPAWENLFQYHFKKNKYSYYELKAASIVIKKYKSQLFRFGITPNKLKNKSIDCLLDTIKDFRLTIQAHKKIKKIINEKYKFLKSEELLNIYKNYIKTGECTSILDDYLRKVILKTSNSKELIDNLCEHINKINNFNYEYIINIVKSFNLKPLYDKDNILIIEINSYIQMKELGPEVWCIVQSESQFQNHIDEISAQFIVYDFNRLKVDKKAISGYTISLTKGIVLYSFDILNNPINDIEHNTHLETILDSLK